MAAEATGVFFYVLPGIAAIATFTLSPATAPVKDENYGLAAFSSIFQIGWAFAIGIAFAIITCAPTSGGHFNPAITVAFAVWQGFPWRKVPHYVFAQVFGAFLAGVLMLGMWWPEVEAFRAATEEGGGELVRNGGVASVLCSFPNPNQTCVSRSIFSYLPRPSSSFFMRTTGEIA